MNGKQILDLPMKWEEDRNVKTVRDYLKKLLATLWEEEESFSGKRPFGNSGWRRDLETPLVLGGAVSGTIDEDGWATVADDGAFHAAIHDAIQALQ